MPLNTPYFNKLLFQYDFPRSSAWRLMTDGWLHPKGPKAFRPEFYRGMEAGFECLSQNLGESLTPDLLEKFHDSAYQFEPRYLGLPEEEMYRMQGFRDCRSSEFAIYLATKDRHEEAGISEAGLNEIVDELIQVWETRARVEYDNENFVKLSDCKKTHMEIPRWSISISNPVNSTECFKETDTLFDEDGTADKAAIRDFLLANLRHAVHAAARGGTNLRILAGPLPRAVIVNFVGQAIARANQDILASASAAKKIEATVQLTRECHQGHYFTDGNGRAFVFLMTNFNLLKSGLGLAFTRNPAHFFGYSKEELSAEVKAGLSDFNEYRITAAKTFLGQVTADQLLKSASEVGGELNQNLSKNPLIALEQLNEIFIQIKANQLLVPKNYYGSLDNRLTNFFYSLDQNKAHQVILVLIKNIYLEKVEAYLATLPSENRPVDLSQSVDSRDLGETNLRQIFLDMLEGHEILDDEDYPHNKTDKNIRVVVNDRLEKHFKPESKEEQGVKSRPLT